MWWDKSICSTGDEIEVFTLLSNRTWQEFSRVGIAYSLSFILLVAPSFSDIGDFDTPLHLPHLGAYPVARCESKH